MSRSIPFVFVLTLTLIASIWTAQEAVAIDLNWSVSDRKSDKRLLDLDARFVENAAGKRILYFDGSRLEDANGNAVLDFDNDTSSGFSIRSPKDSLVRILWSNGHQLHDRVDGKVVFEYDGRNREISINGETSAKYTLTCHNGNLESRLESWQVVAIAYALQPKLFVVSKKDAEAQHAEAKKWAKEERELMANRLFGEFTSLSSSSSVFRDAKVTVKPIGKYVYMNYELADGKKLQGIGIHKNPGEGNDQEQIFTALNADGVIGLGVYEIEKGALKGTWYPTSLLAKPETVLGVENLKGKTGDDLTGQFTITEAKTPDKGDAYSGSLELTKYQRTDSSPLPAYNMTWTLGTIKMAGVGVQVELFDSKTSTRKKYLIAAVGNGEVLVGQHFCVTSSDVHLDFASFGKTIAGPDANSGYIMLIK